MAAPLLSDAVFGLVVAHAPLVSIDLVLRTEAGEMLLGQRRNRPAQGFWFVPGGRVRKAEPLDGALARIVASELGPEFPTVGWRPLGIYQHFYDDSHVAGEQVPTHYVVLAVTMTLPGSGLNWRLQGDDQHDSLQWWTEVAVLGSDRVHANTQAYVHANSGWLQG